MSPCKQSCVRVFLTGRSSLCGWGAGRGGEGTRGVVGCPCLARIGVSSVEDRLFQGRTRACRAAPRPHHRVQRGHSPRDSVHSLGTAPSRVGTGGDRWGQAGLRPQQLLFPFTAQTTSPALCPSGPQGRLPRPAKQSGCQGRSGATPRRSEVPSSEQRRAPGHMLRPESTPARCG